MKYLPIGTEDFSEIIKNNLYYIDKTSAISLIEKNNLNVLLFTRPRRFGKTLFISMLDYFYNIENKEENKKLFKNLDISKSEYIKMQGNYPTISITMKDIYGNNFEDMCESLHLKFRNIFSKIDAFDDLSENLLIAYNKVKKINKSAFKFAFQIFTEAYYQQYNKKVILLIDEYEAPILKAYQKGYVDEAIDFFSTLYSSALKTNPYLEKAIITGITRIDQSNVFSGLNNIVVYGLDSDEFSDSFGYTDKEVLAALREYGLENYKDDVKDYYSGYLFGKNKIYNPWSINNFLYEKKLKPYWAMTSSTEMLSDILKKASNHIKRTFISLLDGGAVNLRNTHPSKLFISDLDDYNKIFAYMITTGYLTYDEDGLVKVVNKEILSTISDISAKALYNNSGDFIFVMKSFILGDLDGILKRMSYLLDDTFSYMDMERSSAKNSYHIALLDFFKSMGIGKVISNLDEKLGRYDIILRSFDKNGYSYVFDIKAAKYKKEIETMLNEAIDKNKKNNYTKAIDDYSKKMIVCFCFYKKEIYMKFEKIN